MPEESHPRHWGHPKKIYRGSSGFGLSKLTGKSGMGGIVCRGRGTGAALDCKSRSAVYKGRVLPGSGEEGGAGETMPWEESIGY